MDRDHRSDESEPEENRRFTPLEWAIWCQVSWIKPASGKVCCEHCGAVAKLLPHSAPPWQDEYLEWMIAQATKLEAEGWLESENKIGFLCPKCRPSSD